MAKSKSVGLKRARRSFSVFTLTAKNRSLYGEGELGRYIRHGHKATFFTLAGAPNGARAEYNLKGLEYIKFLGGPWWRQQNSARYVLV